MRCLINGVINGDDSLLFLSSLVSAVRCGHQYVVNVTPNLPNVFEDSGLIQYLQIPITDHWSQNLASFFPAAINFIGENSPPRLSPVFFEIFLSARQ